MTLDELLKEFDEEFVEKAPGIAEWVDTEHGEKGKCLADLEAFIEKAYRAGEVRGFDRAVTELHKLSKGCRIIELESLSDKLVAVLDGSELEEGSPINLIPEKAIQQLGKKCLTPTNN